MNYKRLVEKAGYKKEQGEYIARKLEELQVTKEQLSNLPRYVRSERFAGEDVFVLTDRLSDAAAELDATEAAVELAKKEGVDVANIQGSGKSGKVTKADVAEATENK